MKAEKKVIHARDLEIGNKIEVAGLLCEVKKLEDIFHYKPDANKRAELKIVGVDAPSSRVVVFFPQAALIELK